MILRRKIAFAYEEFEKTLDRVVKTNKISSYSLKFWENLWFSPELYGKKWKTPQDEALKPTPLWHKVLKIANFNLQFLKNREKVTAVGVFFREAKKP